MDETKWRNEKNIEWKGVAKRLEEGWLAVSDEQRKLQMKRADFLAKQLNVGGVWPGLEALLVQRGEKLRKVKALWNGVESWVEGQRVGVNAFEHCLNDGIEGKDVTMIDGKGVTVRVGGAGLERGMKQQNISLYTSHGLLDITQLSRLFALTTSYVHAALPSSVTVADTQPALPRSSSTFLAALDDYIASRQRVCEDLRCLRVRLEELRDSVLGRADVLRDAVRKEFNGEREVDNGKNFKMPPRTPRRVGAKVMEGGSVRSIDTPRGLKHAPNLATPDAVEGVKRRIKKAVELEADASSDVRASLNTGASSGGAHQAANSRKFGHAVKGKEENDLISQPRTPRSKHVGSRLMLETQSSAAKRRERIGSWGSDSTSFSTRAATDNGAGVSDVREARGKIRVNTAARKGDGEQRGKVKAFDDLAEQVIHFVVEEEEYSVPKPPTMKHKHNGFDVRSNTVNRPLSASLSAMRDRKSGGDLAVRDPLSALGTQAFQPRAEIERTPLKSGKSKSFARIPKANVVHDAASAQTNRKQRVGVRFDVEEGETETPKSGRIRTPSRNYSDVDNDVDERSPVAKTPTRTTNKKAPGTPFAPYTPKAGTPFLGYGSFSVKSGKKGGKGGVGVTPKGGRTPGTGFGSATPGTPFEAWMGERNGDGDLFDENAPSFLDEASGFLGEGGGAGSFAAEKDYAGQDEFGGWSVGGMIGTPGVRGKGGWNLSEEGGFL
ncbi:hypothetical protein HDV00_003709 [Rhizophlyctis rosea]|nr:hypothetical protein HDV00_003709 [Rhizophlyctis rosea]